MTSEHPEISMPQAEPETQEPETPKLDADEPEAEAEPTETEASETEASETEAPDPEAPDPEAPDMEMSDFDNLRLVEALLFASAEPLAPAQIARFLPDDCKLEPLLADLEALYANQIGRASWRARGCGTGRSRWSPVQ